MLYTGLLAETHANQTKVTQAMLTTVALLAII